MAAFREERFSVNGVDAVVLTAGEGEPLVFFHGAGTVTGFDALLPLAERCRLIVPNHPGFGLSGDDPSIGSIPDYLPPNPDVPAPRRAVGDAGRGASDAGLVHDPGRGAPRLAHGGHVHLRGQDLASALARVPGRALPRDDIGGSAPAGGGPRTPAPPPAARARGARA